MVTTLPLYAPQSVENHSRRNVLDYTLGDTLNVPLTSGDDAYQPSLLKPVAARHEHISSRFSADY